MLAGVSAGLCDERYEFALPVTEAVSAADESEDFVDASYVGR